MFEPYHVALGENDNKTFYDWGLWKVYQQDGACKKRAKWGCNPHIDSGKEGETPSTDSGIAFVHKRGMSDADVENSRMRLCAKGIPEILM